MAKSIIKLKAGETRLSTLRDITKQAVTLTLDEGDYVAIKQSKDAVNRICASGETVYGINTGFGKLAQTKISDDNLEQLQINLLLSHACGTGPLLQDPIVRLIMTLKIISLARGHSGVKLETVDALITLVNKDIYPCIPAKGSVGASGDLAPLAHMCIGLLGIGEMRVEGKVLPASECLKIAGLEPLRLDPKEALALINGTQVSTAIALYHLFQTENTFAAAIVTGSMSVDALKGSDAPFDDRIHQLRGHQSQIDVARVYRELLSGSEIRDSHIDCSKVQDAYSLRCQPQVMGAVLESIRHAAKVLTIEANSVTDNPLIFSDTDEALSGGNFHAEPVALVADQLAVAIAEIGAISERRIATLVDPLLSELPAFLVENAGLNSGFMIAHVTAASLASENKSFAHPASVDSLPTSANQEDHVSMATFAAYRLGEMIKNTDGIIAIELLAACQAIEFHLPLNTSKDLHAVFTEVRKNVPNYQVDRYFAPDIEACISMINSGGLSNNVREILPSYA
jgi:histidine ammonia-lyase